MEKFYIVSNEKFLKEIDDYIKNEKARDAFVKQFFENTGIAQRGYILRGNGWCNQPFTEYYKNDISLCIDDCEENNAKFGKELCKTSILSDGSKVRKFRKNSKTLKAFQDLCIKENVVINNDFHCEGDYFAELHLGGYSVKRFSYDKKYYLYIETYRDTITPEYEGFDEITGSQFYIAFEKYKKSKEEKAV